MLLKNVQVDTHPTETEIALQLIQKIHQLKNLALVDIVLMEMEIVC